MKFEPIATACAGKDGWGEPAPPAHIYGNVYMVGTCGIVSLLITTPKGHFLIDSAIPEGRPGNRTEYPRSWLQPEKCPLSLNTHEHFDHSGGLAGLKRLTGARMVARAEAKDALESTVHPSDPQKGLFDPVERRESRPVDRRWRNAKNRQPDTDRDSHARTSPGGTGTGQVAKTENASISSLPIA